jgi:hypothetical protein
MDELQKIERAWTRGSEGRVEATGDIAPDPLAHRWVGWDCVFPKPCKVKKAFVIVGSRNFDAVALRKVEGRGNRHKTKFNSILERTIWPE